MSDPTSKELQAMAREVFGREVSAAEAEAYRARLPALARTKALLRDWAPHLAGTEPATVYRVANPDETADERR